VVVFGPIALLEPLAVLDDASATPEARDQARQDVIQILNEMRGAVWAAVDMTSDPATRAALNAIASAIGGVISIASTGTGAAILAAMGEGSHYAVTVGYLDDLCGEA
jgi:hypothetical protein